MQSKSYKYSIYSLLTVAVVAFMTTTLAAQTTAVKTVDAAGNSVQTSTSKSDKQTAEVVPEADEKIKPAEVQENLVGKQITPEKFNVSQPAFPRADVKIPSAVKPAKQTSSESDWQFAFSPYLYATGISGTVGARGRTFEIDQSFGDILSNLDLGLMGTFEAKKGKLIFLNDLIWTKMSVERDTPGALYSDAKLGVNLFIFDPEVGYRVVEQQAGSVDLLGGVRIWSVENNLNLRTGILPGFDVSERKTFAAPVVGVHGLLNLSPKFYLTGKFDIGGGIGADFTTQFFGGAGYRIKPNIAITGGYRYLKVDYDDNEGFLFDTQMSGLMFGAKFSF